jgi:hypothetical protein
MECVVKGSITILSRPASPVELMRAWRSQAFSEAVSGSRSPMTRLRPDRFAA